MSGLEAETVRFQDYERLSHFLLLQHDGVSWAPCAQVLPNNTAQVLAAPTWTCCEEAAILTLWQIALVALATLLLILGISVGAVTLRRQLHKQKMSKGPYRVILTPADFVFPQVGDNRRVSFCFGKSLFPFSILCKLNYLLENLEFRLGLYLMKV